MESSKSSQKSSPFKSLLTGIIISMLLTLFLYFGIRLACTYLIQVTVSLIALIIISSLLFWINLKHDYMSDLMNTISSTVAFDYRFSRSDSPAAITDVLKRINPFIGALGTFSGLLLLLWTLPALIITLISPHEISDKYVFLSAFLMSTGLCTAYYFTNRDQFPAGTGIFSFYAGIATGSFGMYKILSLIFS
jgi:hypothetical protein